MNLRVSNRIYLPRTEVDRDLLDDLKAIFVKGNPAFFKKQSMGFSTHGVPRTVSTIKIGRGEVSVPRGAFDVLFETLQAHGISWKIKDERFVSSRKVPFKFIPTHVLYPFQSSGVRNGIRNTQGYINAVCASGKTTILLKLAAYLQQPTLFIVHNSLLMEQTVAEASRLLQLPLEKIGTIGGTSKSKMIKSTARGKYTDFTVGMVRSLIRDLEMIKSGRFGCIELDEGHHSPASTFFDLIDAFDAKYRFTATATPTRKDGLSFLIWQLFGRELIHITDDDLQEVGRAMPVTVQLLPTEYFFDYFDDVYFETLYDQGDIDEIDYDVLATSLKERRDFLDDQNKKPKGYNELIDDMDQDEERNQLIADKILEEANKGETILALALRRETVVKWRNRLRSLGLDPMIMMGGGDSETREAKKALKEGRLKSAVATLQFLIEGIDIPPLSCGFLLNPVAADNYGMLTQAIGRFKRPDEGKANAKFIIPWDRRIRRFQDVKQVLARRFNVEVLD